MWRRQIWRGAVFSFDESTGGWRRRLGPAPRVVAEFGLLCLWLSGGAWRRERRGWLTRQTPPSTHCCPRPSSRHVRTQEETHPHVDPTVKLHTLSLTQVIAASYVEGHVQKHAVLTRFSVPEAAALRGSPEAEGAAAALDAAAAAISARRGITLSLSQVVGRASGSLARERAKMVTLLATAPRSDLNHALPTCHLAAVLESGGSAVVALLTSHAPGGEAGRFVRPLPRCPRRRVSKGRPPPPPRPPSQSSRRRAGDSRAGFDTFESVAG